jgi:hypothetical protein
MRVNFQVINQKDVPALQSGTILPPAGQKGRVFFNSAGVGMYIDSGNAWVPISSNAGNPYLGASQIGYGDYNTGLLTSSNNLVYNTNEQIFFLAFDGYRKIQYGSGAVILGDISNEYEYSMVLIGENIKFFRYAENVKVGINGFGDPTATLEVFGKIKISPSIFAEPAALEFDTTMLTGALGASIDNSIRILVGGVEYALPLYSLP